MPGVGYITTNSFNQETTQYMLSTDESMCGMLFDLTHFVNPFYNFPLIKQYFADDVVHVIHNLAEAAMYGLTDNSFMNGIPYYHIKTFYDYVGTDVPLYLCFTTDGVKWTAVSKMQSEAQGKMFQIGVWTAQYMWEYKSCGFTDLLGNLETAAEELTGKVGTQTLGTSPLSLVVFPNTVAGAEMTIQNIPDATELNFPKLSVCLVQNSTTEVKAMQAKHRLSPPVHCMGQLLACLNLAYAEECIGYVDKFDLNKNDDFNNASLITFDGETKPIDEVSQYLDSIALKGYIVPCTYDGKEAGVFFSGDPTLSNGDYCTISNNRVMHKCRRAVHSALLPYLNAGHLLDVVNGGLSSAAQTTLSTAITSMLDSVMVNQKGQFQINGRTANVSKSDDILVTDGIAVDLSVGLVNYNKVINEQDDYTI